jgi:hypothetical protein
MADETAQEIPDPMNAAPDIPDETAPEPAPVEVDQPTTAPKADDSDIIATFRQLWHGGERRMAYELAQAERIAIESWDALVDEFPDLLKINN